MKMLKFVNIYLWQQIVFLHRNLRKFYQSNNQINNPMGVICGNSSKAIKQDQFYQNTFQSQNTLITFGCQKNQQPQNKIRSSMKQQSNERLTPLTNAPISTNNQIFDNQSIQVTPSKLQLIVKTIHTINPLKEGQNSNLQIFRVSSQNRIVQYDIPEQENSRTYYIIRWPIQH
ncbi:hypothetical protein pb186bvf_002777 [Paramecium bursaria]